MVQSIGGAHRRSRLHSLTPKGIEVHEHRLSANSLDIQPRGLLVGDVQTRLHLIGHESAQGREAVPIVLSEPMVRHTQGCVEVELISSSRNGDVEQPLFLFETFWCAQRHVDGDRAVNDMGDVDDGPLEAFGRVDGRDHQIVLIEMRRPGQIAA